MEGRDLRIKLKLDKLYPNNEVVGLTRKDNKLYIEVLNEAKKKNLKVRNYIESLGFIYLSGWKEELTESEAINLLNGLFPKKVIKNISYITKKNTILYSYLNKISKEKGIKVRDCLEELGFEYFNAGRDSNYDLKAIKILYRDYNVNMSELARIIGITKQNLDQKVKATRINNNSSKICEFTDEELKLIINVIKSRVHYYEDNSNKIIIKIYHGIDDIGINAILYKEHLKIKICFNLPDIIRKEIYKFEFNKYEEQDMEILKIIHSEDDSVKIYKEDDEDKDGLIPIVIKDSRIKSKISYRANYLKMNLKEYSRYLGIKILDKRKYTDEYIKELLEKYQLYNNVIKIPIGTPDYIRMIRISKKRGYNGLEELITSYGFEYERIRDAGDTDKNYKEIIEKRYIVEDKKIYINSLDPFYNRICSYCYKHNTVLNDYISNLGFERIDNVNELPKNYIQYDWKTEESDRKKNIYSDENITLFLDEFANENNEIYIDTTSQSYSNLWKIANIRDMSINDLIEMLGYKRIYARDNHKLERHRIEDVKIESDEKSINEKLDELEKIQGSLDKIKNENEKFKRNQTLVKKIKKLYNNTCQLCCPDDSGFSVPPIEKENGEIYVEVHHIKQISEAFKDNDESDELIDSYKNVIVVCSYHHKYLHYYHGGCKEIIKKKDGQLYFKSKFGDTIKIFTNYHLISTNTNNEE